MSTNNFTYRNICVVVHDTTEYYCEPCEIYQQDNDTCEECGELMRDNHCNDFYGIDIENWAGLLAEKIKGFEVPTRRKWTRDEALILGSIDIERKNGEDYATIYATYKSGYYCGACLDYIVEYEDDSWGDEVRLKTLDKKIDVKCRQIAKVLRSFGTEVRKVAQFSNGEAVYEKVK